MSKTTQNRYTELGRFQVKSGFLKVSDPCYAEGTWCAGDIKARNGWWSAGTLAGKVPGWGDRVLMLAVAAPHVDAQRLIELAQMGPSFTRGGEAMGSAGVLVDSGIDVGVDSGQCGFFDRDSYKDRADKAGLREIASWALKTLDGGGANLIKTTLEEGDAFYAACCSLTLAAPYAGVLPAGCVSSSGVGDGSYKCMVRMDGDEVIGAVLVYIDPSDAGE